MQFKKRQLAIAATSILIGAILGLALSSGLNLPARAYSEERRGISQEAINVLSKTGQALAEVSAAVKPSVVNISSTHTVKTPGIGNPFHNDPFFRRFFGDEFGPMTKPREYKQSSLGSGVIVSKDGYILTNNHVIKDADEIKVKLSDKREFTGKVIGTDPRTDLAVVKINSNHLPVMKLGDSEKLMVGETVIAIGNPYGLNQTVTSGIVSATGRANVGIADYEDFIQTDAAINPGNSGGALVNVRGELVGINTAIFSTSGGYQGIGFAIPSSMAKTVMENLISRGKVVRGWLGVSIQEITPDLAKQFKLKSENGVLVGDVVEGGPAEKAGIARGDVILEFNGKQVDDPGALRNMVANTPPNKDVSLKVLHDGKTKTVKVTVAELPADLQKISGKSDGSLRGLRVGDITPALRKSLRLPKNISGVIVTDVESGSPAEGVMGKNDIILEINRKAVKNLRDYKSVVSKIKPDQHVLLLVYRDSSTFYVTLSG